MLSSKPNLAKLALLVMSSLLTLAPAPAFAQRPWARWRQRWQEMALARAEHAQVPAQVPAPASAALGASEPTIAGVASTVPELSILLEAVAKCDPVLDAATNSGTTATLFAPTNTAFANALAALGISKEDLLADTQTLCNILEYHIIRSTDATESVINVPTLFVDQTVAIQKVGDAVMVNEAKPITDT
eukprot:gene19226-25847_t